MGPGGWLERDFGQARDLRQGNAQAIQHFQQPLHLRIVLVGVHVKETREECDPLIDPRVVLHGATSERVEVPVDAEAPMGQPRVMSHHVQLADFGQRGRSIGKQGLGNGRRGSTDGTSDSAGSGRQSRRADLEQQRLRVTQRLGHDVHRSRCPHLHAGRRAGRPRPFGSCRWKRHVPFLFPTFHVALGTPVVLTSGPESNDRRSPEFFQFVFRPTFRTAAVGQPAEAVPTLRAYRRALPRLPPTLNVPIPPHQVDRQEREANGQQHQQSDADVNPRLPGATRHRGQPPTRRSPRASASR